MAIEVGMKVKATCLNGEIYEGEITHICLGMCKESPTQASIILIDNLYKKITYGNVHIWCNGLKNIEEIKSEEKNNTENIQKYTNCKLCSCSTCDITPCDSCEVCGGRYTTICARNNSKRSYL